MSDDGECKDFEKGALATGEAGDSIQRRTDDFENLVENEGSTMEIAEPRAPRKNHFVCFRLSTKINTSMYWTIVKDSSDPQHRNKRKMGEYL